MSRVTVIGAGISGLAAAALMAQDGHEVTVLERADAVGGRAGRIDDAGFTFDTGPSWYLMPEVFDDFFRRFGTTAARELDLVPLDPAYRLYPRHGAQPAAASGAAGAGGSAGDGADDGADGPGGAGGGAGASGAASPPVDVRSDRTDLHALFESREPGAAAALDAHLAESSALYDLASEHALRTDFGREHRGAAGLPRRLRAWGAIAAGAVRSLWLGSGMDPDTRAADGAEDSGDAGQTAGGWSALRLLARLPGLLTGSYQELVHARFRDPLLRQILLYPAVFLATDPARAPGLYHLMSRMDLMDGVSYPQGGMHTIISAFARVAQAQGVEIRTGVEVVALTPERGARARRGVEAGTGTGVGRRAPAGRGACAGLGLGGRRGIAQVTARVRVPGTQREQLEIFEPDWVVAACDLHHLETQLLPRSLRSAGTRTWTRRDPGMGALVVMLGVEGRIPGLAHHSLFFTEDWDENFSHVFGGRTAELPEPASVYLCAPSVTDPAAAPEGDENLFFLVPAPANPSLRAGQRAVEEYVDRMIDAVGERVGAPDLRARVRVRHVRAPGDFATGFHAWSGTALGPAHTLGQSAMFRDSVVSPRVGNLLRTGAFTAPGVGLPMCVMSAENAAQALRVLDRSRAASATSGRDPHAPVQERGAAS